MKVTILGAGAWGTALGLVLTRNGHRVRLWGRNPDRLNDIKRNRRNDYYLPNLELPGDWEYEPDLSGAVEGVEYVVTAIPSRALREVTRPLRHYQGTLVSVSKGIEFETGLTMCGILRETMPEATSVALAGPTIAAEVARGMPCAIVAAGIEEDSAKAVQDLFHQQTFRVYTSTDLIGVEMGGALKNVVAIAAGVCDGLGFGDNSKAGLITRGIVEVRRLGVATGAHAETFSGLSGLGDMMVTCFSRHSRNRNFGEQLGRGVGIEESLAHVKYTVEGFPTARAAFQLARKLKVATPIIDQAYAMLYEEKNLEQAIHDLTSRTSKAED